MEETDKIVKDLKRYPEVMAIILSPFEDPNRCGGDEKWYGVVLEVRLRTHAIPKTI